MSDTTEFREMTEHQMIEYARRMRQERDRYREALEEAAETLESITRTEGIQLAHQEAVRVRKALEKS